jgi:hypothetical protein
VVIATGYDHDPDLPDWPGRQGYPGELIHSSAYHNPGPYRARRSGGWAQCDGLSTLSEYLTALGAQARITVTIGERTFEHVLTEEQR